MAHQFQAVTYSNGDKVLYRTNPSDGLFLLIEGAFEWGQRNNLAFNLAREMLNQPAFIDRYHPISTETIMAFVDEFVSKENPDGFVLTFAEVEAWLSKQIPF